MDSFSELSVVDSSHGYCRVTRKGCIYSQSFEPIVIKYLPICSESQVSDENLIEYQYYCRNYDKVLTMGELLLERLPRSTARRGLLEILVRSAVHLSETSNALEFMRILSEESCAEDAGRDHLNMWAFERLKMYDNCIESCLDYLKIRPGDLIAVQTIVKCLEVLDKDASEWQMRMSQIIHSYSRS